MNSNPSSILDLKAELHKKYDAVRKTKLSQTNEITKRTPLRCKDDTIKEKKGKKHHIQSTSLKHIDNEEEIALEKSRLALEAKAKLYENIISNKILVDDEQNESYLVDFQRKVLYEEPYTPTKSNSVISNQHENSGLKNVSIENSFKKTKPLSNTTKIQESTLDPNEPIHYQNIRFNEVRDHGTGYFAFSTNAEKRKEQMEELKTMRTETEKHRKFKESILKKRNAMLQARLAKVCERKNINPSVLESYTEKNETDETNQTPNDVSSIPNDVSSIPMPEENIVQNKETKTRPWDIGKDNLEAFIPEKRKKTHKDWMEERREERSFEFAPPSFYSQNS